MGATCERADEGRDLQGAYEGQHAHLHMWTACADMFPTGNHTGLIHTLPDVWVMVLQDDSDAHVAGSGSNVCASSWISLPSHDSYSA